MLLQLHIDRLKEKNLILIEELNKLKDDVVDEQNSDDFFDIDK